MVASGYSTPSSSVCRAFQNGIGGFSRGELAMFLAQVIHESGDFQYKEDIAYTRNRPNHSAYVDNVGLRGRDYHGRGFIQVCINTKYNNYSFSQLTWGANYKAASEGLGMGDKLLRNTHLVAEDDDLAMLVSTWYWKAAGSGRYSSALRPTPSTGRSNARVDGTRGPLTGTRSTSR